MELERHQLALRYERLRKRPPLAERALGGSLAEHGQQLPIVVVGEAARFVLIDGDKRVRALKRLSHDTVRATDWRLPALDALLLERRLRGRGEDALFGLRLLPTGPIFWPAPMVSQRNHAEFVASDIVNDAVGEPTQRHTAPLSPLRTKLRMIREKSEGSFELCDEGMAKLGAAFPSVEKCSFG